VIFIASLTLEVLDGSTIASTEIYGANKKTYINIGSGNVFKLQWVTSDIIVDHYDLVIKRHKPEVNVYDVIFDKNIGLVNEFYVDSAILPDFTMPYETSIYLVAYGKQGSVLTSNVVNPYVCKGCGTYVKVQPDGYEQPIMKRAVALVKTKPDRITLTTVEEGEASVTSSAVSANYAEAVLRDSEGYILRDITKKVLFSVPATTVEMELADITGQLLVDDTGRTLFAEVSNLLENPDGWTIMQEIYTKDDANNWRINDIEYEVLVDKTGEIIYTLNDGKYEPVYVL